MAHQFNVPAELLFRVGRATTGAGKGSCGSETRIFPSRPTVAQMIYDIRLR
jgi:hypothetical protein